MITAAATLATLFTIAFVAMEACKLRERLFPGRQAASDDWVVAAIGLAMEANRTLNRWRAR